jgi:long-chain fatty acid transport protein
VGAEMPLNESTTVRAGYMFDYSPVPDQSVGPLFPDANRNSMTFGASKKIENKEFSVFYEAMFFENRVTNVPANNYQYTNGDYSNFVNVFGFALRFDATGFSLKKH